MEATTAPLFQDDPQPVEEATDLPGAKSACIVAIDPGLTGAVAFYFPSAPNRVAVEDMPVVNGQVDSHGLDRLIERMGPTLAIIEHVNAMPSIPGKGGQRRSMGAQSAFNFGRAYEAARTTLSLSGAPLHLVQPAAWKKHFRLIGGDGIYRLEREAPAGDRRRPSPAPVPEALALDAIRSGAPMRRDGDLFGRVA